MNKQTHEQDYDARFLIKDTKKSLIGMQGKVDVKAKTRCFKSINFITFHSFFWGSFSVEEPLRALCGLSRVSWFMFHAKGLL